MFSSFQTVERVVYGGAWPAKLGDEVLRLNCRRVGVITDKGLVDAGIHTPVDGGPQKLGHRCPAL